MAAVIVLMWTVWWACHTLYDFGYAVGRTAVAVMRCT